MYLLIDTVSFPEESHVHLLSAKGVSKKDVKLKSRELVSGFKNNPLLKKTIAGDLKGIMVVNGPGAFGQVRQGVAVANTLAWSLGVPIRALQIGDKLDVKKGFARKIIKPIYSRPPNITKPR